MPRAVRGHSGTLAQPTVHRAKAGGPISPGLTGGRKLWNACPYGVECRPRWACAYRAKKLLPCSFPIRELVVSIRAPCGDHRQNEEAAGAKQFLIRAGIAIADLLRHMSEVELDRPAATRLEINEQGPALRVKQIARMWLSMQQLLGGGALADLTSLTS
jgi:hypothetical protein